ncbi:MAG: hypothetical protein HOP16_04290 [Acidobacteria bacterium]|nr:hypothetical protein [Acidobacteriota bacterium]
MAVLSFLGIALTVFAIFGLVLMTSAYATVIAHAMARRKGYHSVGAKVVVGVGLLGWLVVFVALLMSDWWLLTFVSPVAAPMVMVLLVRVLPRRRTRHFGRRHGTRQLVIAGWITGITGAFATTLGLSFVVRPITSSSELAVLAMLAILGWVLWFVIGQALIAAGRFAQRQPTLDAAFVKDPRPPVLYVRPFDTERLPFVLGESYRYARFYRGHGGPGQGVPVMIALENYLSDPISRRIGPFVALGSPEDLIPPMGGALRKYATDEGWQREFDQLARSAAAIVLEVRESANLNWELEHIRRCGLQQRLIVLTEHPTWRRLKSAALWAWLESLMGFSKPSWSDFVSALGKLGYEMTEADPGPGSIVTFNANGRGVILTTCADVPTDYVTSIGLHVARSGR